MLKYSLTYIENAKVSSNKYWKMSKYFLTNVRKMLEYLQQILKNVKVPVDKRQKMLEYFQQILKNVKVLFNKQWKILEYFSQKNQTPWHCTNYKPISWPQKELTRKLNRTPPEMSCWAVGCHWTDDMLWFGAVYIL